MLRERSMTNLEKKQKLLEKLKQSKWYKCSTEDSRCTKWYTKLADRKITITMPETYIEDLGYLDIYLSDFMDLIYIIYLQEDADNEEKENKILDEMLGDK